MKNCAVCRATTPPTACSGAAVTPPAGTTEAQAGLHAVSTRRYLLKSGRPRITPQAVSTRRYPLKCGRSRITPEAVSTRGPCSWVGQTVAVLGPQLGRSPAGRCCGCAVPVLTDAFCLDVPMTRPR